MKFIENFIKSYLKKKLAYEIINSSVIFVLALISFFFIFIIFEINAYFEPFIKQKIYNLVLSLSFAFIIFIILKFLIHRYNIFNNSNFLDLSTELIDKIPTKDRIINALQIYSKIDLDDPYSDLTINAVDKLENELKSININEIKYSFHKKYIYLMIIFFLAFISLTSFNEYNKAYHRLINREIKFNREFSFSLVLKQSNINNLFYKGENVNVIVDSKGNSPNKINFHIKSKNISRIIETNKINGAYELNLNNIDQESIIWATYSNQPIIPFNKFTITTDTFYVKLKKRPEIKNLEIIITPPKYTNINNLIHNKSLKRIEILEGSKLTINAKFDKKIKYANFKFNKDSIIKIKSDLNEIRFNTYIQSSFDLDFQSIDFENYASIPIKYQIVKIDDLPPMASIKFPENNFKIDQVNNIPLEIEATDDIGLNQIILEYKLNKPYYVSQDTVTYQMKIKNIEELNKKNININYEWNIKRLNLSPGDEVLYWIKAYDNKYEAFNIGKSNIHRAYIPSLEELYFAVEEEQQVIDQNFNEMLESVDELKNMYDNISNDILKEQAGLEQTQEIMTMGEELEQISDQIKDLETAIQTIEELNAKNDLINEKLSEKIEKLQNIFKDMLNSELMDALNDLQNSINQDDFQKSLEELNNLNFEIDDLESQLDRMIDLFEQIVAEQKMNELVKKINQMSDFQKKISKAVNENHNDKNIDPMLNVQKENLSDFNQNLEQARAITQNVDSTLANKIDELIDNQKNSNMNDLLNEMQNKKNENLMNQNSNKAEKEIESIKEQLEKLIEEYQKKSSIEMLNSFSRVIKNLIDMSYEQEKLIIKSEKLKSKKDTIIFDIAKKENILLQQYKSVFLQISDLSKQSFHISAETSKTFSKIFVHLSKTIAGLEQGRISESKKNQYNVMLYINQTVLHLINAMKNMQNSGEASGYSQYLESMEQLMSGQQQINQGMNSLIPMPFGQQENGQGLMQSLMQQQQQLKNQLEQLLDENSTSPTDQQGDGLGQALDDMDKILEDFKNNQFSQESIDRGKQVYKRLLEHKNAMQNRGYDNKWEAKENNKNQWEETKNIDQNKLNNNELKKLYKTLDDIENNKNLSTENKKIIQEYLKILINEKINEK